MADPSKIRTVSAPSARVGRIPDLKAVLPLRPQEISRLGRHRTEGIVLAVLHDKSALLKTRDGLVVRVDIGEDTAPRPGQSIIAIGFPESNLYNLDLIRAIWKPAPHQNQAPPTAVDFAPEDVSFSANEYRVIDSRYHGRIIRFIGKVLNLPDHENSERIIRLKHGPQKGHT